MVVVRVNSIEKSIDRMKSKIDVDLNNNANNVIAKIDKIASDNYDFRIQVTSDIASLKTKMGEEYVTKDQCTRSQEQCLRNHQSRK